jgi:hypothetical protein
MRDSPSIGSREGKNCYQARRWARPVTRCSHGLWDYVIWTLAPCERRTARGVSHMHVIFFVKNLKRRHHLIICSIILRRLATGRACWLKRSMSHVNFLVEGCWKVNLKLSQPNKISRHRAPWRIIGGNYHLGCVWEIWRWMFWLLLHLPLVINVCWLRHLKSWLLDSGIQVGKLITAKYGASACDVFDWHIGSWDWVELLFW